MSDLLSQLRRRSTWWFSIACIYHTVLAIACIAGLARVNAPGILPEPANVTATQLWLNSALLGSLGSLLYFSRKAYVYLITDKVGRLHTEALKAAAPAEIPSVDTALDVISAKINGYILYLFMRPLAGVVIGPLLVMTILAGLSTVGRGEVSPSAISPTGIILVLVLSFVAGYKSSDMFDHFSKMGTKLIGKADA